MSVKHPWIQFLFLWFLRKAEFQDSHYIGFWTSGFWMWVTSMPHTSGNIRPFSFLSFFLCALVFCLHVYREGVRSLGTGITGSCKLHAMWALGIGFYISWDRVSHWLQLSQGNSLVLASRMLGLQAWVTTPILFLKCSSRLESPGVPAPRHSWKVPELSLVGKNLISMSDVCLARFTVVSYPSTSLCLDCGLGIQLDLSVR